MDRRKDWKRLAITWTTIIVSWAPGWRLAAREESFAAAARNADQAAAALRAADRAQRAWAARADATTGLLPQNLTSPLWTPSNSAADLYPFFVLTSCFTDRASFEGRWRKVLLTETLLTSRLGPLPDDYSLEKSAFTHEKPDLSRIIFGSSEYVKDGLIPITELLGPTPWFTRLREIEDAIIEAAPVPSRFGKLPSDSAEVNGNVLQSVARLYWATACARYLDLGERILRAYLEEVAPGSGGLPVHRWDFTAHAPVSDTLSLNDHGNEILGGLAEIFLALSEARPQAAAALRPAFVRMIDRLLEIARNPDGLWFARIRPATGEVLDRATPDTWGYALTAVYIAHIVTGEERYREAVRKALSSLKNPAYDTWKGADSIADSVEGGILLVNREPVPEALEWIDRVFPSMLASQRPDGIVEGWHGDGNFARTALLYAFLKSRGTSLHPWREDLRLGAEQEGERLFILVRAGAPWEGVLRFDHARHSEFLHLPKNYPRLNEFPVWFAAGASTAYRITGLGQGLRACGLELRDGIPLRLGAGEELRLEVEPEPRVASAPRPAPRLGKTALILEVEGFAGSWMTQTNYPGYSGWGFRVSNANDVARTVLRETVHATDPGELFVWARGLASSGGDRGFSVEVAGHRFGPTHRSSDKTAFVWERCGSVRLEAGDAEIVIHDEGRGFECPDALFISPQADDRPPQGGTCAPLLAPDVAATLTAANLARLIELHDSDDAIRRSSVADAKAWEDRRPVLSTRVRRALGLDPEPERGPLKARGAGTLERDGHRIEKIVFESRPGMPVPANLYLPAGPSAPPPPWPAVLCPVGHWPLSKAQPVVQARAAGLARLGIAALAYDPVGQGERAVPGNEHSQAYLAALAGESNMTYMIWDSIRALDYLETRPDIDSRWIGITGCSGGGLNTLYAIAVDARLRAAVPVCYVSSFASFLKTGLGHCPCSHVPGMGRLTDMDEVASLFAPRPLLVVGGLKDPMFTESGTREAFAGIQKLYRFQGSADAARLFFDDCDHDYSRPMRERAYGLFVHELAGKGSGEPLPEPMTGTGWEPEKPEALFCFTTGRAPENAVTYRRSVLDRLIANRGKSPDLVRAAIRDALPAPDAAAWRSGPIAGAPGAATVTGEDGLKHRVLSLGPEDAASAVLLLDDAGLTEGTHRILEALADGSKARAIAIEPPFWSATGSEAHLALTNGLLLGRPLATVWARTLLGHVQLERARGRRVFILAQGPGASLVALAALVSGHAACEALAAAHAPSSWTDLAEPGVNRPGALLPGGGLAGDVTDLLRAASPLRVLWSGSVLRARLPPSIEVREEGVSAEEAARWMQGVPVR